MNFWTAPLGSDFPLGTDTAWTLIAVALASIVSLAAPLVLFRARPANPALGSLLGARMAAVVADASRGALWAGVAIALGAFALPGTGIERGVRAGLVAVGLVLGIAVAWRSVGLISRYLANASTVRGAHAHRVGPQLTATGAGAASLIVAVLVAVQRQDSAPAMIALALGLGVTGIGIRTAQALAGMSAAAATFGVGAIEQEQSAGAAGDPGVELGVLARALANGPRRALDAAALAALLPGVLILTGVPLLGTSAIISALVLSLAFILATLLPLVLPFIGSGEEKSERRMRAIGGTLSGAIPAIGALAALALWIPSEYAKLRMRQVGLENFTDPLLLSLFVDPQAAQQGQTPSAINRDTVEPHIAELAKGFDEFYKSVGDAPSAQSVIDTIVLHTINPAHVTALALAIGTAFALLLAGFVAYSARATGAPRFRHARAARVSPVSVELSGRALAAPGILVVLFGFVGLWALITSSAGISYLAFYLVALAGAAIAIVGAGYTALTGAEADGLDRFAELTGATEDAIDEATEDVADRHEPAPESDELSGSDETDGDADSTPTDEDDILGGGSEAAMPDEPSARTEVAAAVARPARALVSLFGAVSATLLVASLVAPLGGEIRAAKKAVSLWDDRSLRVLYLDSPTVLGGVLLGAIALFAASALIADPVRRALATVTTDARATFAASSTNSSEAPRTHVDSLGGDARRIAALALVAAIMGPLVSGFGLGAASLPGYAAGALVSGLVVTVASIVRGAAARQALAVIEGRPESTTGPGSLAHIHALSAHYTEQIRSAAGAIVGATGVGSFALITGITAHVSAPLVVQFATDGTNPWIRPVAVVAAVLLVAGVAALARGVTEPALDGDDVETEPLFDVKNQ